MLGRRSNYQKLCQHFDREIELRIRHHAAGCTAACLQPPSPQELGTYIGKRQLGEVLKAYMEQHYPQFMKQLRECTNHSLTPTEELICIFGKLAMRNKQVADILKISLSSVSKTRYRVKNKMDIAPNEDLDEWLRRCGEPITILPPRHIFQPSEGEDGI